MTDTFTRRAPSAQLSPAPPPRFTSDTTLGTGRIRGRLTALAATPVLLGGLLATGAGLSSPTTAAAHGAIAGRSPATGTPAQHCAPGSAVEGPHVHLQPVVVD